jgi:hypothetical protein
LNRLDPPAATIFLPAALQPVLPPAPMRELGSRSGRRQRIFHRPARIAAKWGHTSATMPELRHITRIAADEQVITTIRGTVKVHLHNIYTKLGINKRTALVAIALAHREELMSPPR